MFRVLQAAIAVFLAATATAATAVDGPPIAFVKGTAKGNAIYLVYPDGTGLTKVYQAPSRGRGFGSNVGRMAMIPAGGEIAFTQDETLLQILNYDSNGQRVSIREITVDNNQCALGDVDYRSDGTLVLSDGCRNVWTVTQNATAASFLFQAGQNIAAVRWMLDGSILFHEGQLGSMALKKRTPTGTITTIAATDYFPPFLGMSRIANETAISDRSTYKMVNLTSGATVNGPCNPAGVVHLSPNSTQILYRSSKRILFVHNANCSGMPFRLATGVDDALAWRAD